MTTTLKGGRELEGILGIGPTTRADGAATFDGYDGRLTVVAHEGNPEGMPAGIEVWVDDLVPIEREEREELAQIMVERWRKWGGLAAETNNMPDGSRLFVLTTEERLCLVQATDTLTALQCARGKPTSVPQGLRGRLARFTPGAPVMAVELEAELNAKEKQAGLNPPGERTVRVQWSALVGMLNALKAADGSVSALVSMASDDDDIETLDEVRAAILVGNRIVGVGGADGPWVPEGTVEGFLDAVRSGERRAKLVPSEVKPVMWSDADLCTCGHRRDMHRGTRGATCTVVGCGVCRGYHLETSDGDSATFALVPMNNAAPPDGELRMRKAESHLGDLELRVGHGAVDFARHEGKVLARLDELEACSANQNTSIDTLIEVATRAQERTVNAYAGLLALIELMKANAGVNHEQRSALQVIADALAEVA